MSKLSSTFKPYVEKWYEGLKKINEPYQAIGTVRADATLIADQASEVDHEGHILVSDEPSTVGGSDKGPNPLEYFMASVGFCENVTFARYAALNGLNFESLQTSVRGHWDRRGQLDLMKIEPAFTDFIVETKITSTDPIEKIRRVVKTVHERCPMHSTITKASRVTDKLFVNGLEVPL